MSHMCCMTHNKEKKNQVLISWCNCMISDNERISKLEDMFYDQCKISESCDKFDWQVSGYYEKNIGIVKMEFAKRFLVYKDMCLCATYWFY